MGGWRASGTAPKRWSTGSSNTSTGRAGSGSPRRNPHHLSAPFRQPPENTAFNAGIPKRNPKKAHVVITSRDDFEELKQDETVDIVGSLPGITGGMKKTLKEKLGRRNTYAHPSTMTITRASVDEMVTDLVNNIVLALTL
jgi:hypothetical protein